jgi:hypothetical protein
MQVTAALTSFFLFQILHARVQKIFPHHEVEKVYFGVKGSCHYGFMLDTRDSRDSPVCATCNVLRALGCGGGQHEGFFPLQ